jgi:hypothetical protein
MTAAGGSPPMAAISSRTISLLIRMYGCLIVVSEGRAATATEESSKPADVLRHPAAGPAQRYERAHFFVTRRRCQGFGTVHAVSPLPPTEVRLDKIKQKGVRI